MAKYFAQYVPSYASFAATLMEKLRVGREEGKEGSMVEVKWDEEEEQAFQKLKTQLMLRKSLLKPDPSRPFVP